MINYNIADLIARMHVASSKKIVLVKTLKTLANLRLLILLQKEGFIDGFRVYNNNLLVFLKFDPINEFLYLIM